MRSSRVITLLEETVLAAGLALFLKKVGIGLEPALISYGIIVFTGGFAALVKGDFFARGMAVTFLTGPFGLVVLLTAPSRRKQKVSGEWRISGKVEEKSKGGKNDEDEGKTDISGEYSEKEHAEIWPSDGWIGLIGVVIFVFFLKLL